jgi:acetyl coenzyme A synthetase (ADP forming)-like protein
MVAATYPAQFESDVVLRSGRTLHVRPVRPEDCDRMVRFYADLSPESIHARFFHICSPESALESAPADVDYDRSFGVIGETGNEIVGVAHYYGSLSDSGDAEVAFTVADAHQGSGIATKLLEALTFAARTHRIERFVAEVLPDNRRMVNVFRAMGFVVTAASDSGTIHLSFPIASTPSSEQRASQRSQEAAVASMRAVFAPRSIAVVGASRRPGALGREILHNLWTTGFQGALYAVNPNAVDVESVPVFRSVSAIEGEVDLAIIAVPALIVESVLDDCIAKKVRAVVIISAGFSETGGEGRAMERRLLEKVRAAGMRMVGPNCLGVINTAADVNMHGTFSPVFPPRGTVAMSSQSGALGLAVLDYARILNIGFSTFISVGNKPDVSGNDLIQYWSDDPNTNVILLYLESFGNPKKFAEIARRVGRQKPIVAVKAGRSAAGARAAASHTGALAASDSVVDELFRHSGVIRTDTLEEMFDVTALLANQPLPKGNRVAIVTNAGGPGILAADACEAKGLTLARLSDETMARLRDILPPAASVANPVDMIASASADQYRQTLQLVQSDTGVDSVIAIYIPVLPSHTADVEAAIRSSADWSGKTVVATLMSAAGTAAAVAPVPAFPFPERAVHALALATRYSEWRGSPDGNAVIFDIDATQLRSLVENVVARGGGWLDPAEVNEALRAAGLQAPATAFVTSEDAAVDAANRIGFPVALKADGPELLHKSDRGGVMLGLKDAPSVRAAYNALTAALGASMTGTVVQKMISGGVEMMIGATRDATFGHVVAAGAGGTLVEILRDVRFRLHPLTDIDAETMIEQLRCAPVLRGYRGSPPSDVAALKDAILRVSALLDVCPEIAELDINPVTVHQSGVTALDARIRVERAAAMAGARRISY